jgi:UbiA prenyltransferase family protein
MGQESARKRRIRGSESSTPLLKTVTLCPSDASTAAVALHNSSLPPQARFPLMKTNLMRYSRFIRDDLIGLIRADEWWEYKLVPVLSAFYATALVLHVAVISLWPGALALLLSIAAAAVYASVINDVTDRADDVRAGKRNRVAERSRSIVAALLAATVCAGFIFGWLCRDDARLLSCYLAIWVAFSLYSFPPFRFKKRGFPGVLCDAAGAHLFPALVAVFIACRGAQRAVSGAWVASVAVWALAYGLRGILWHQLTDVENDRAAGVRTFARRHPRAAPAIGTFAVFPVEVGALAAMLWQIRSPWPPAFLALYVLYAIRSARRWQTTPVVVVPKPRFFIVMHEFYSDLFPVALLIAAVVRDRRDLVVLAVHVLIFPRRMFHALRRIASMPGNALASYRR